MQANFDDLGITRLDGAADERRLDRQFTMSPVNQHAQAHSLGTPQVKKPVHRRTNRASRVEHVIHDDQVLVVDGKRNVAGLQDRLGGHFGKVIAIESDIQRAHRHVNTIDAAHRLRDSSREGNAAAAHADQSQIRGAPAFFDNFVGYALNRAIDFRRRHQLRLFDDAHWPNMLAQSRRVSKRVVGPRRVFSAFPQIHRTVERSRVLRFSKVTVPGALDLSVNVGALRLSNPIVAASGTFGYGVEFAHLVDLNRLGGIVVKGLSLEPIAGAPAPRLCETPSGMLNAVGLQNLGVRAFVTEKLPTLRQYHTAVIANVFGYTIEEYATVIRVLEDAEGLAAYELNISCPNTAHGGIQFGSDPQMVSEVVSAARQAAQGRPLWVKLSPNVTDIAVVARVAQEAGADALTVANTFQAMSVDIQTRKSRLGRASGGLSGPAIKPITLHLVYEASRAVKIPVVGLGGVETAEDVLEYLIVGASAVQVGTANFSDPQACERILVQLEKRCRIDKTNAISSLIGSFLADCP